MKFKPCYLLLAFVLAICDNGYCQDGSPTNRSAEVKAFLEKLKSLDDEEVQAKA